MNLFNNLITALLSGIFIHLTIGSMLSWGFLKPYVASYYHEVNESNTVKDLYSGLAIMNLIEALGQFITTWLLRYVNHRVILAIAAVLISAGTGFAIYLPDSTSFMWVYCLSTGFTAVLAYLPPLMCAWESYPDYKGLITGIVISSYGLSSFLFNFIFVVLQNPEEKEPVSVGNDKYFTHDINERLPATLQYQAIIFLVLMTLGCIMCNRGGAKQAEDKEKLVENKGGAKYSEVKEKLLENQEVEEESGNGADVGMAPFTSYSFYIPYALNALSSLTGLYTVNNFQNIGLDKNYSLKYLNYVAMMGPIFNCLGRFLLSMVSDKFGYKAGYTFMLSMQVICTLLLQIDNEILYCCATTVLFMVYGAHLTYAAVFYANLYEPLVSAKVYSLFFSSFTIGNLLFIVLAAVFENCSHSTNYYTLSTYNAVLLLILLSFNFDITHLKKRFKLMIENDTDAKPLVK